MGRTTVFIDESLIKEVLEVTNIRTKKEAIERGLRELLNYETFRIKG